MSTARRPLIAGNWKMHKTVAEARQLANALRAKVAAGGPEVVVCPPATALFAVAEELKGSAIAWGGQNMDWHAKGAFTGEIAPGMLTDLGCTFVIVGHSERRTLFGETDEAVCQKAEAALANGLTPIICVGETLEQREAALTDNVVIVQVQRALHGWTAEQVAKVVFAYEPVWAIGTGKTCESQEADRVCGLIRDTLARLADQATADGVRILYGGSVKPETIAEQMAKPHVDGALVGGACLEADSFAAIANYQAVAR
ncbi:MAG: tpiA [Cyanobacteria bacterium RYN_339]|nr:tpiA [Cyanobacteria bacterium RYN_339]